MTKFIMLCICVSSIANATTWIYDAEEKRHYNLEIEKWNGQYSISGSLYYTDGVNGRFYKWNGQIERLPSGLYDTDGKVVIKSAVIKFSSDEKVCMVPIEVILYLPQGMNTINNFYIESKIPLNNVNPIDGDPSSRCKDPQYFWTRDKMPYRIIERRFTDSRP